jgi:hypothetical protein
MPRSNGLSERSGPLKLGDPAAVNPRKLGGVGKIGNCEGTGRFGNGLLGEVPGSTILDNWKNGAAVINCRSIWLEMRT